MTLTRQWCHDNLFSNLISVIVFKFTGYIFWLSWISSCVYLLFADFIFIVFVPSAQVLMCGLIYTSYKFLTYLKNQLKDSTISSLLGLPFLRPLFLSGNVITSAQIIKSKHHACACFFSSHRVNPLFDIANFFAISLCPWPMTVANKE